MSAYSDGLTIRQAQTNQPWTVPYSDGVDTAAHGTDGVPGVPHILGSHCVLHAAKSLGKIAAVYEARDHKPDEEIWKDWASNPASNSDIARERSERREEIRKMAADLMTAALRFANLEGFDLAEALVERVQEKNGADFGPLPGDPQRTWP